MTDIKDIAASIASALSLPKDKVANVLSLLADKCTIPFICRYRKEMTGGMDETTVESIIKLQNQIIAVDERRSAIIKSIEEQGKLTPELQKSLEKATSLSDWRISIFLISQRNARKRRRLVCSDLKVWQR